MLSEEINKDVFRFLPLPKLSDILSLAINTSDHIFAGTQGGGVCRSEDNGNSWTEINTGLKNAVVGSLTINSSGYIFAGTEGGGVFRKCTANCQTTHRCGS